MAVITGHHKPVQWTVVYSRICCYKLAEKSTTQAADTHDQTGQQTPEEEEETCPGEEGDTQKKKDKILAEERKTKKIKFLYCLTASAPLWLVVQYDEQVFGGIVETVVDGSTCVVSSVLTKPEKGSGEVRFL